MKMFLLLNEGKNIVINNGIGRGKTLAGLCWAMNSIIKSCRSKKKPYLKQINQDEHREEYQNGREIGNFRSVIVIPTTSLISYYKNILQNFVYKVKLIPNISVMDELNLTTNVWVTTPGELMKQWKNSNNTIFFKNLKFVMLEDLEIIFHKKKKDMEPPIFEFIRSLSDKHQLLVTSYMMNNVGLDKYVTKFSQIFNAPSVIMGGLEVSPPDNSKIHKQIDISIEGNPIKFNFEKYNKDPKLMNLLFVNEQELKFDNHFWNVYRKNKTNKVLTSSEFLKAVKKKITNDTTIIVPNNISTFDIKKSLRCDIVKEQESLHLPLKSHAIVIGIDSMRHLHVITTKCKTITLIFSKYDFTTADYHMIERLIVRCGLNS